MEPTYRRLAYRTAARLLFVVLLANAAYWISPFAVRRVVDRALAGTHPMVTNDAPSAGRDGRSAMLNEAFEVARTNALLIQYHAHSLHQVFPVSHR